MGIETTREKILEVADRLFSRFGFHKTSMDEIAKTSRKAKGSLYYHFSSKEELFREVVLKEANQLKARLSLVVYDADLSAGGKLKKYFMERMEELKGATNYHETIRADFFENFDFIDDIRKDLDNWEKEKISMILSEGLEKEEFESEVSAKVLGEVLIMVLKGMEIPFFLQAKYEEYNPYFEDLSKIMLKGLRK